MKTYNPVLVSLIILFNSVLFAQNDIKSISIVKQRLDSILIIETNEKIEYVYNALGQNTNMNHYTWSNNKMKYVQDYGNEYSYNDKGQCILVQNYKLIGSITNPSLYAKYEYNYDENNQKLLCHYFLWNFTLNKWELESKTDYVNSYDNDNKLVSTLLFKNIKSTTDVKKTRYDYTYNENGDVLSVTFLSTQGGNLLYDLREDYTYDTNKNLTTLTYSEYTVGAWSFKTKNDYSYNNQIGVNQLLIPNDYIPTNLLLPTGFIYSHMITSHTYKSAWSSYSKKYYYSPLEVTGINNQEILSTVIYPNPTTDYLNIYWQGDQAILNVELYDVRGKKLLNQRITNHSKLPIHIYSKGLYFVKISDRNKTLKTEKVYFN